MSRNPPEQVSSTVRRWQLTEALRRMREEAGLTVEQAATELGKMGGRWSRAKISRIENRTQGFKIREIEQLLTLYQADARTRATLLDFAESANERGWWVAYRKDIPEELHPFLNLEAALVALRQFETTLVPGLFQTGEYARTLVRTIYPDLSEVELERRVAARLARQQILARERAPQIHVILDQHVLTRPVGGSPVMAAQLRRLVELARSPHITIQVVPASVGAYTGLEGPFAILTLPEPVPDIGYVEGVGGAAYLDSPDDVRSCTLRFGILTGQALSPAQSVNLIAATAKGFE